MDQSQIHIDTQVLTKYLMVWEPQEALSRASRVGLFLSSSNETLIYKTLIVSFRWLGLVEIRGP